MNQEFSLPFRQIHLDFHTSPAIRDVGRDFDADAFAQTMQDACVSSVTVFAKCHHGHLYHDTQRPERHPGLKPGLDLTGSQVKALHQHGIRAPIYISIQVDEYAAQLHPEWVVRNPDGSQCKGWGNSNVFAPGWHILDMSSPYQEFVYEQSIEILEKLEPVDGVFFDMCWDQPSSSVYAIAGMQKLGLDPESETDRDRYATLVSLNYMERFYKLVKSTSPEATVFFNGRQIYDLPQDIKYLEQVEIEALPTGGWGYLYFPLNVRFARTFEKPCMGMTGRFHLSWGDFGGLKPYPALEYETSQMIAHGARCSVGDQLPPRGKLDKASYELIGRAYRRVMEREPWLEGAQALTQVGLFRLPSSGHSTTQSSSRTDEGAVRMLTQLKVQFDLVQTNSKLEKYELLVLPDALPLDIVLVQRLQAYLRNGGKILATGTSGLTEDGWEVLLPELAVEPEGFSPYSVTYIRFGERISGGVPETDHVVYENGVRAKPTKGSQGLAGVVEPYFERTWDHFCSHHQTPPAELSSYLAASINGNVGYISYPIFHLFAQYGNQSHRWLVQKLLEMLLTEPLLKVSGPTSLETSVMRQSSTRTGERNIVHLLFYTPERRAQNLDLIEDIIPLYNLPFALKLDRAPKRVYLAPERKSLTFEYKDGYAQIIVPEINGHAMVVFE
jgi:hypothetical protein